MTFIRRVLAEFLGTFWLTFGGCGAAVISAAYPQLGIGFIGVAFAFGLTVLTGVYAVGNISGGHFNPAVTVGLWVGGRFSTLYVLPYIVVQVLGAVAAAAILKIVAEGQPDFVLGRFASNGYGDLSPGHYTLLSAAIIEPILAFFFLFVIMGATSPSAPAGFAGLAIGLALTLIHLISIPITNTSVNPARSTGPALFAGAEYVKQLWFFWAAPIGGAVIAGLVGRLLYREPH
ncbi:aquaporin Z [Methylocapsa polymorpha]|uniref:Aquaporin Z n=1 Tax=Methylocapsa polymorpha TaxID=3080828 RepID=A0ABZ0HQ94_9HYPH|nr:aquaporin Z [Methylocapsa sp. RX1]